MKILINMEPTACPRPRVTRYSTYYPKKYNDFKNELESILYDLKEEMFEIGKPLELSINFFLKIPKSTSKKKKEELEGQYVIKKPDIDNYIKSIMDGMNDIIYKDDNQIVKLTSTKRYSKDDGYIEIDINYIGDF